MRETDPAFNLQCSLTNLGSVLQWFDRWFAALSTTEQYAVIRRYIALNAIGAGDRQLADEVEEWSEAQVRAYARRIGMLPR